MKYLFALVCLSLILACNQSDSGKKNDKGGDTSLTVDPSLPAPDSLSAKTNRDTFTSGENDELLMQVSSEILQSLKTKNFVKLATFVHPVKGIRFSPYSFIDTINGQVMSASQLIITGKKQMPLKWGVFDGSGDTITMSIDKYFERFVYNHDFLKAEKKSVNKSNGGGNSLDNLHVVYTNADYTEFYFSGFDPKYGGMDWQKLRLVFTMQSKRPYLIAIVHDEWTI